MAGERKILAVASGGGHWVQLRRLVPAFEGLDVVYVSVEPAPPADLDGAGYHAVRAATRRDPLGALLLLGQMGRILLAERPDVVITTGSLPGLVAIALAKLGFRSRTIWLDSIANVDRLSSSGRLARFFADHWLTQWAHLARPGGPEFRGQIL